MLTQRVIPSLLLSAGRLVKGCKFSDYVDAGLPHTTARAHNAQGADEIFVSDIEAARLGRGPDLDAVRKIAAEIFIPLTVAGGIDSLERAGQVFEAGADKISLNGGALDDPELITRVAQRFGSQAVVLAVDIVRVDGKPRVFDHRIHAPRQAVNPIGWIGEAIDRGAGEIRICAVDREGTREGIDGDFLRQALDRFNAPILIEGGIGSFEQLDQALSMGPAGICLGTLLVFSDANIVKIKRYLASKGIAVRT